VARDSGEERVTCCPGIDAARKLYSSAAVWLEVVKPRKDLHVRNLWQSQPIGR